MNLSEQINRAVEQHGTHDAQCGLGLRWHDGIRKRILALVKQWPCIEFCNRPFLMVNGENVPLPPCQWVPDRRKSGEPNSSQPTHQLTFDIWLQHIWVACDYQPQPEDDIRVKTEYCEQHAVVYTNVAEIIAFQGLNAAIDYLHGVIVQRDHLRPRLKEMRIESAYWYSVGGLANHPIEAAREMRQKLKLGWQAVRGPVHRGIWFPGDRDYADE